MKIGKYEAIYQKLRERLTDEEIADSMLIPADLTPEERMLANEELRKFRFQQLAEMSTEKRMYADLLRFKYQMEDYIEHQPYRESMNFGAQIEEYINLTKRSKRKFAEELNINSDELSRVIDNQDIPTLAFLYQLEAHSSQLIPALLWWELLIKKQKYQIVEDIETRKVEAAQVTSIRI